MTWKYAECVILLWSFHYKKKMFLEVYVYSHRLRTLFVAGEHCDYDTTAWATRIFDVSTIQLLSSNFLKQEKNFPMDEGSYTFFA
jgi:hypothetical protein